MKVRAKGFRLMKFGNDNGACYIVCHKNQIWDAEITRNDENKINLKRGNVLAVVPKQILTDYFEEA